MEFPDKNIIDEELNKFKKERPIYSRFVNLKIKLTLYFNNLCNKRYQECNPLHKLFRMRWYLLVPFKFFYYTYIKEFKVYMDEVIDGQYTHTDKFEVYKGKNLWRLLVGDIQGKLNFYWTMDEVNEMLKEKKKKYDR